MAAPEEQTFSTISSDGREEKVEFSLVNWCLEPPIEQEKRAGFSLQYSLALL